MGSKKSRNADKARRDTVLIGQVHGDRVHPRWALNVRLVDKRDSLTGQNRIIGVLDSAASGAHVATGRCKIVRDFLRHPAKPDWLWMIDTDATFEPTILDQLIESADPVERPIVGGLAFGLKPAQGADGLEIMNGLGAGPVEVFPTLYLFDAKGSAYRIWNYAADSLVEVHGTGAHCLLVHRSVLEHEHWDTEHPLPWFRSGTVLNGGEVSEDLFFCIHAKAAGFPIFVNTAAKTGHIKEIVVDESMFRAQQEQLGGGRRERVVLVPSRDPVLCRDTVRQVLRDGGHGELVVAWNGDNQAFRDWLGTQPVTVVDVDPAAGIHAWWNWAIDNRPGADVMLLNDDLRMAPNFVPGLFERLYLGEPVAVVCPNYDGRPGSGMVAVEGICAGRYDGTGGLSGFAFAMNGDWLAATGFRFPEDCRWWFGDNDLMATVAAHGHVAAMALDVRCEHLGGRTGDWDAPEMLAQLEADRAAFEAKWAAYAVPA